MPRILLVEPHDSTSKTVQSLLAHAGYTVAVVDTGQDAITLTNLYEYDVVLTETALPDMTGMELVKALRLQHVATPIVALSANESTETKLQFFGFGGDAFISKPFHREELLAQLNAIVRRTNANLRNKVQTSDLCVDLDKREATVKGHRAEITNHEFALLEILSLRKGAVLTKEILMLHLYKGAEDRPELREIDVMISILRKKLSHLTGGENYIQTVWGHGYKLSDPERIAA
jgi:two-component system cell cycle response regulator CtrA